MQILYLFSNVFYFTDTKIRSLIFSIQIQHYSLPAHTFLIQMVLNVCRSFKTVKRQRGPIVIINTIFVCYKQYPKGALRYRLVCTNFELLDKNTGLFFFLKYREFLPGAPITQHTVQTCSM